MKRSSSHNHPSQQMWTKFGLDKSGHMVNLPEEVYTVLSLVTPLFSPPSDNPIDLYYSRTGTLLFLQNAKRICPFSQAVLFVWNACLHNTHQSFLYFRCFFLKNVVCQLFLTKLFRMPVSYFLSLLQYCFLHSTYHYQINCISFYLLYVPFPSR